MFPRVKHPQNPASQVTHDHVFTPKSACGTLLPGHGQTWGHPWIGRSGFGSQFPAGSHLQRPLLSLSHPPWRVWDSWSDGSEGTSRDGGREGREGREGGKGEKEGEKGGKGEEKEGEKKGKK